jgi:hypothetical protein
MTHRWMTLSPPDRLIGACETALARLEATGGDPPHIFAETGEVLFWLFAIGDTGKDNLLSRGSSGHGINTRTAT